MPSVSCKKDSKATTSAVQGEGVLVPEANNSDAQYSIVQARSIVTWAGAKLAGNHTGTLQVSDGSISMNDGSVSGGVLGSPIDSFIKKEEIM